MKVQIGIRQVQNEVEIDVDMTADDIAKAFDDAVKDDKSLILKDSEGTTLFVRGSAVGYIRTSSSGSRRVGFGFTN